MFDTLGRADQCEVRKRIFLLLALLHDFLAFLDKAHHSLAGLGAGGLAQELEAFVDPLDLGLGLMKNLLIQDLKNLSANKEVSETIRKLALKMYKQKLDAANKK